MSAAWGILQLYSEIMGLKSKVLRLSPHGMASIRPPWLEFQFRISGPKHGGMVCITLRFEICILTGILVNYELVGSIFATHKVDRKNDNS